MQIRWTFIQWKIISHMFLVKPVCNAEPLYILPFYLEKKSYERRVSNNR